MTTTIVGIAGGTGSGKSSLALDLARIVGSDRVQVLSLDSYYRSQAQLTQAERAGVNYDHPDALDISLLIEHLTILQSGLSAEIPTYDFAKHERAVKTERVAPREFVVIEGILTLYFSELRGRFGYSVFVDTPDALRFERRLRRDVRERGRTEASVLAQWTDSVQPMHEKFCLPTQQYASEVFDGSSWGDENVSQLWGRIVKQSRHT
jgi:uridine kinase